MLKKLKTLISRRFFDPNDFENIQEFLALGLFLVRILAEIHGKLCLSSSGSLGKGLST